MDMNEYIFGLDTTTGKFKILADQNTDLLIFILEKIATAPARLGKILAEPEMQNTDGANFKKKYKNTKMFTKWVAVARKSLLTTDFCIIFRDTADGDIFGQK